MRMVPYMPLSTTTMIDRQVVLDGGGELLAIHQEVAVAGEADDGALTVQALRRTAAGTP